MSTTSQKHAKDIESKGAELKKLFDDHKDDAGAYTLDADQIAEARRRNDELTEIGKKFDQAKALEAIEGTVDRIGVEAKQAVHPSRHGNPRGAGNGDGGELALYGGNGYGTPAVVQKSMGDLIVESPQYKSVASRRGRRSEGFEVDDFDLKATFTTTGLTQFMRPPGIVMIGNQPLRVSDLLASGTTNMTTIRFMRENTYTNAATTVAEGGLKPEATLDLVEADSSVRKIAVLARISDEMFSDFPTVRGYIDERIPFMVLEREEAQLLNGDGNSPNLRGILATTGIQTQAMAGDTSIDAVYHAMTKVRAVGFFEPDGLVIHPNDWSPIRLLKTGAGAGGGAYIWGHPSEVGPERVFGLRTVVTTAITEGTGLVGGFRLGAQVFRRQGMTVEMTNSNEDDFERNLISIRAEIRIALCVYRPKAFCTVTGI